MLEFNSLCTSFENALEGRTRPAALAVCVVLTWLSLGGVSQAADDARARAIVDRATQLFVSRTSIATVEMHIVRSNWQRKISMQFWLRGESHILVRIRQPQEDAGTAILKAGNKAWQYLPKAKRTIELSSAMTTTSWMGSHFTLHDLVSQSSLTKDYAVANTFEGQRDGVALSEFTLTPNPSAAVVWGKITLEIRQSDSMPLRQRYYDEDGKLVRELSFSEFKTVSGRLIPTRLIMRPMDQALRNERTTITYITLVFDQPIVDEMFSLKNLTP